MKAPVVIAVTVNRNRSGDTIACLQFLKKQTLGLSQIIVVENGSDEEPSFISQNPYNDIEVIDTGANLGFGAGANVGIRRALELGADYVLVINNDTVADAHFLEALIAGSQKAGFEITAPLIYYYAEPDEVWSAGGDICKLIGLPLDAHHRKDPPAEAVKRTFLTGCCLLFSRHALESLGLFDEAYFMYYEDLDLMARALKVKTCVGVVPSAKLWHKEAQSSGGYLNPNERYWSARSLMRYSKRATRWWNAVPLWAHRLISIALWTFRLLLKRKPEALKAYWQGIRDGLRTKQADRLVSK